MKWELKSEVMVGRVSHLSRRMMPMEAGFEWAETSIGKGGFQLSCRWIWVWTWSGSGR